MSPNRAYVFVTLYMYNDMKGFIVVRWWIYIYWKHCQPLKNRHSNNFTVKSYLNILSYIMHYVTSSKNMSCRHTLDVSKHWHHVRINDVDGVLKSPQSALKFAILYFWWVITIHWTLISEIGCNKLLFKSFFIPFTWPVISLIDQPSPF